MRAVTLVLVALLFAGCSSTSTGGLPSRSDAIAYFKSLGFSGAESSAQASASASAAPLWVGHGPDDALGEVSGVGSTTDWVSVSVDGQEGGEMLDAFLKHFAPGSGSFYTEVLNDTASGNSQDQSRTIGGRRVRIQTIATGNSYLIAMTVTAASAPAT